jgi:hypothetical protein
MVFYPLFIIAEHSALIVSACPKAVTKGIPAVTASIHRLNAMLDDQKTSQADERQFTNL